MGWLDGLWGGKSDPLGKLDPAIKEFLEKESPVKYHMPKPKEKEDTKELPKSTSAAELEAQDMLANPRPLVPKESLFQDGRYAHIWNSYRPINEIEAENKTDNEKLSDILDAYRERKRLIAKAAVENCSDEQFNWRHCMTEGGIRAKATMCSKEVRAFERCYGVQSRLLKALGYIELLGRPPEVEEDIQIHAFDLYQTMLKQESAIKTAREAGEPIPEFPALIKRTPSEEEAYIGTLPLAAQDELRAKLDAAGAVNSTRRAHALGLWKRDYTDSTGLAQEMDKYWKEREVERQQRLREGSASFMDKVKSLWTPIAKDDDSQRSGNDCGKKQE